MKISKSKHRAKYRPMAGSMTWPRLMSLNAHIATNKEQQLEGKNLAVFSKLTAIRGQQQKLLLRLLIITITISPITVLAQLQQLPPNPSQIYFQPAFEAQQVARARAIITVTGSEPLLRQADRVDAIIMPYDNFTIPSQPIEEFINTNSYVIDHKRFVEPYATRCLSSTLLEDPDFFEPTFVLIKPGSELQVNATASIESIRKAGYEPSKRTTIFIHGFTQSYPTTDWLRKIRALYEKNSHIAQQNLIIMDWGIASHGSYSQVAARVSGMGSFLANFLMKLVEMGSDRMSMHLIGHSLGAHISGFAGKRMRPRKLGRITALDPAGPCFGKLFSNSPTDRLSPDDAYEVDVYHYDDLFLGLPGQHGHWDVFVNGGSSQPGCKDNVNAMFQALITMVFRRNRNLSESHTRSTEVPTCQLAQTSCQQVAYECRDWPAFVAGECGQCDQENSQCFFMGFPFQYGPNVHPLPLRQQFPGKKLFIATSPQEEFCLQHYQILVKFEASQEFTQLVKRQRWRIHLELNNERGENASVVLTNQLAPNIFSYLFLSEQRPARLVSALMQIRSSLDNTVIPLRQLTKSNKLAAGAGPAQPSIKVNLIEIIFMSDIDPQGRRAMSSLLCPVGWMPAFVAARQRSLASRDSANLISTDPQDDWLGFDECN